MSKKFTEFLSGQLEDLKNKGLYKVEREIASPQQAHLQMKDGQKVINFCSNNYLGLANHPEIIRAAQESFKSYGYGLASVRFICGTQTIHTQLENKISAFLGTEDSILYSSCFDANGGFFETLFNAEDAIISDELNHASLIDGIRLCKAQRYRYRNNDMNDLEEKLKESKKARYRIIVTDGVFSMDGIIANLKEICNLADRYDALVMVDDSHAVGIMGKHGKGTPEYCGVMDRIDVMTGTLGKALGGASGGYTTGKKPIIEWLRQRSRPYLFSNTLSPTITSASLKVLELIQGAADLRHQLHENTRYFRDNLSKLGFKIIPGHHPIVPIMLGEARLAQEFARQMLSLGIYVIGFCYPVVPEGKARIRTQMSAAHQRNDLDIALEAFRKVGSALNVI